MKAPISPPADAGLVHTVRGLSGNLHDVLYGNSCMGNKWTLAAMWGLPASLATLTFLV